MVTIYYAYTEILSTGRLDNLIGQLSPPNRLKLSHFKRDEDKMLLVLSSALLSNALSENGFGNLKLSDLQYSETGRPFFPGSRFDFNISHTGNCAAVVFSNDCRVGIDVETIKEIDLSDFSEYFASEQWNDINSSEDRFNKFYYYWTLIESGVKAEGGGLSLISTRSIKLTNGNLFIDNVKWFYKHFSLINRFPAV